MRLFLDANVLFSAAKSDGLMRELLMRLARAGHELCADEYVLEEARRNLGLEYPSAAPALETLMEVVAMQAGAVRIRPHSPLPLPAKDQPVMEAAIRHGCRILVTGDKAHFGPLFGKSIEGVEVLSPAQVAGKLLSR